MQEKRQQILVIILMIFSAAAFAHKNSGDVWYISLLVDPNPKVVNTGVRLVYSGYSEDLLAMDIIASRLHNEIDLMGDKQYKDFLAWYAKALGKSKRLKYREILLVAKKRAEKTTAFKHIANALDELTLGPNTRFTPEISTTPMQFNTSARSEYQAPELESFLAIELGMHADLLIAAVRRPFQTSLLSANYHQYSMTGEIILHYPGVGIVFLKPTATLNGAYGVSSWNLEPFDVLSIYKGENKGLAQLLAIFRGQEFRQLLKENQQEIMADEFLLKVLGERIAVYIPNAIDRYEEDAIAIAVKLLAGANCDCFYPYIKSVSNNIRIGKAYGIANSIIRKIGGDL